MHVVYMVPGLGPCGGLRVIFEHANRLQERGHDVLIAAANYHTKSDWFPLKVPTTEIGPERLGELYKHQWDVVVATNPDTFHWLLDSNIPSRRRFFFCQMLEYIFWPQFSAPWHRSIDAYYRAASTHTPVITISRWGERVMRDVFHINHIFQIDNGVNQEHFHPVGTERGFILIEGDDRNPAKDVGHLAYDIGLELAAKHNIDIFATSALPQEYSEIKSYLNPTVEQYRELYSGALFLLKASRFDFRACAPVEAASCRTTTVRAIVQGDDDLIHDLNCLRVPYNYEALREAAEYLIKHKSTRQRLARNAMTYVSQKLRWKPVIDRLERIYDA